MTVSAAVTRPCVLVFAGLDPSGGAGLAADARAIAAQGAHALLVCTALTVQDNDRVFDVQPVDPDLVLRQARALMGKMTISAVKVGIPGSAANALVIAQVIQELRMAQRHPPAAQPHGHEAQQQPSAQPHRHEAQQQPSVQPYRDEMPPHLPTAQPDLPLVLDPVLASGHGDVLTRGDAVAALAPLLPLVTVLTPNGPEAQALTGSTCAQEQADLLRARGCAGVLITGGHGDGDVVVNRWFGTAAREWRWPRLPGQFHGSGCTLAAAIAGQLALNALRSSGQLAPGAASSCGQLALDAAHIAALEQAQQYCHGALRNAYAVAPGQKIPQH